MTVDAYLDPEEEMMIARISGFVHDNLQYDHYNPQSWSAESNLWDWITRSAGVRKYVNFRRFGFGNFEYDPRGEILRLLSQVYLNERDRFSHLIQMMINNCNLNDEKRNEVNRYLSVFTMECDNENQLLPTSGITDRRDSDRHMIFRYLSTFPAEDEALRGAIERYAMGGADSNRQCLDSCRNIIENIVKKISENTQWTEGLRNLVSSSNIRDLFKKTHAYLSSFGVHATSVPNQRDTELGLKMTEDLIAWLIKSQQNIPY